MNYCTVPIINNLHPGDCGLWYDVLIDIDAVDLDPAYIITAKITLTD